MSKVFNFRAETINDVEIPAGTALKEWGDAPMRGMIRYELPMSLHHCGSKHIDLYPHQVGDSWEYGDFARSMAARHHAFATSHQPGENWY
jgi:hypothetical protein